MEAEVFLSGIAAGTDAAILVGVTFGRAEGAAAAAFRGFIYGEGYAASDACVVDVVACFYIHGNLSYGHCVRECHAS